MPEGPSPNDRDRKPPASRPDLERTLDSDEFPAEPDQGGKATGPDDLERTLDSAELPPADAPADAPGETWDSVQVPAAPSSGPDEPGAVNLDETLEMEDDEATGNRIGTGTEPGAQTDRTVERKPDRPPGGSTFDDDGPGATRDAPNMTAGTPEQITAMWGDAAEADRPRMTIKGTQAATISKRSTLVIQTRAVRPAGEQPPADRARRADYDLLRLLGEGGMGVVYMARQASIDRTVAIKMLKQQTARDETQRRKFLAEAVITGDLDHPHIVPIYDLGTNDDGALFYSMKRVEGTPWEKRIYDLPVHENLEILMKVADAVAFAHSRGVIHRDLKPENVMLGEFGEVLVMDWGLAIPTADFKKNRNVAASQSMGGTPAYMAPEMATGPFEKICCASDTYLLGGILYEIVTGMPPHTGRDVMRCLVAASKNEIVPTRVKSELVDIALKAMATEPQDRYATVQDFQNAIRSYLAHSESIALATRAEEDLANARRTGEYQHYAQSVFGFQEALNLWDGNQRAAEGIGKARLAYARNAYEKGDYDLGVSLLDRTVARHAELYEEIQRAQQERDARQRRLKRAKRVVAGLVVLVFAVVTGFSIWVAVERNKAIEQRQIAEANAAEASRQKTIAVQNEQEARRSEEQAIQARKAEAQQRRIADQKRQEAERQRKIAVAAREAQEYEAYIARIGLADAKIRENSFDQARQLLRQCVPDEPNDRGWPNWEWARLAFLCQQREYKEAGAPVQAIDVSPDQKRIVSGGWDGLVKIWTIDSDAPPLVIRPGTATFINAVAFSPDGRLVASGSNDAAGGYLRLWDAHTGAPVRTLEGHEDTVWSVAFSGDGRWLLSSSYDGTARLWDVSSGRLMHTFAGHDAWVWCAALSADQKRLVTAGQDGYALVWSVETGQRLAEFMGHRVGGHQVPIYAAAFSPDGLVATGGADHRVLVWDPDRVGRLDEKAVARSVAAVLDETVTDVDPLPPQPVVATLRGHAAAVWSVAFSEDGRRVISGSADNTVKVWDARSGESVKTLRGHAGSVRSCRFFLKDNLATSAGYDRTIKVWDVNAYEEVRVLQGHQDAVLAASFSADGRYVVTASRDRTAMIWDVASGRPQRTLREGHQYMASTAIFFPDGNRLLTAAGDNTVRIWDVGKGTVETAFSVVDPQREKRGLGGVAALSSDGRWVLTGGGKVASDGRNDVWTAKLWDAQTGDLLHVLEGHRGEVTAVAFSPDAGILLTGDDNGRCVLWERETGRMIRRFSDDDRINAAVFLPDGERVLTASNYHDVRQWLVATGNEVSSLRLPHPDSVVSMAVSADGRWALTGCSDGKVRLWDVQRAERVGELAVQGGRSTFAQNLRRYLQSLHRRDFTRQQRQEAQRQWIRQCGVPESLVNDLLAAKTEASPQVARTLAAALGIRPADLWRAAFSVAISPDGSRGMTVSEWDRTVRLWKLPEGEEVLFPVAPQQQGPFLDFSGKILRGLVSSAAFSPQADRVVTIGGDAARLWEVDPDRLPDERQLMTFSPHGAVASAQFAPEGNCVVTGGWDRSARLWDVETGKVFRKLGYEVGRPHREHGGRVNGAAFSPDGRWLATAGDDRTAKLWNAKDGSLVQTFRGHEGSVLHVAFSADGKRIVTSSADGTARVWDAQSGEPRYVLAADEARRFAVLQSAFAVDGKHIATAHQDNAARVWRLDADAATLQHTLQGHTHPVTSVAFSPDGTRILTGSEDTSARLWDSSTGREILALKGRHTAGVTSVGFSPDGRYVLTGSKDATAILWPAVAR